MCVPNMVSTGTMSLTVSSTVEHQFRELAVAGSIPVPHVGCKPTPPGTSQDVSTMKPKGGERSLDQPSLRFSVMTAAWEDTLQDADSAAALTRQRCVNGLADGS